MKTIRILIHNRSWLWKTAALLIFLRALYEAIRLRWLSDDAFISFRYALNLSRGQGLVFNAGEYVEGFTNLLWTLLVAPALSMGLDAGSFSMALSIGSMALLLGFFLFRAFQPSSQCAAKNEASSGMSGESEALFALDCRGDSSSQATEGQQRPEEQVWLLSFFLLAGIHHFHVFATSGLETMAFTLCASAGTLLLIEGRRIPSLWLLSVGSLLRPDGVLFLAFAYGFILWQDFQAKIRVGALVATQKEKVERTIAGIQLRNCPQFPDQYFALLLPLIPLVSSEIWRIYYYGDLLPNTFYAKSAYSPYAFQGLSYIFLFYSSYWYLPSLLLAGSIILFVRRRMPRTWFSLLLLVVLWHGYVIWVGGDFMFARFLVPILPLLCYLIAVPLIHFLSGLNLAQGHPGVFWVSLLLIVLPVLRVDKYGELKRQGKEPAIHGIVEERYYYPPKKMAELAGNAKSYRSVVRNSELRVAFHGGAAFLIYYMDPGYALESSTGLTDRILARRILTQRGRIGHEKEATLQYMKERNVHIYMWPPAPENLNRQITFAGFWAPWQIVEYDAGVFETLRKDPRIQFSFRPATPP